VFEVEPDSFTCPVHAVDLTPQVLATLRDSRPPVAMPGVRLAGRARKKQFAVVVTCPGGGGGHDGETEHAQLCEGRYRR
jgi:hypothetical protein